MQTFDAQCRAQGQQLLLVLDDAFAELCADAFHGTASTETTAVIKASAITRVLYYPRRDLAKAGYLKRIGLFLAFINKLIAFHADLAFNIEEDTTTSRLTQLSGARFRLGCSPARHGVGYQYVLPIDYAKRPPERLHRWYSYQEVFAAAGLKTAQPAYMSLRINKVDESLLKKLDEIGLGVRRGYGIAKYRTCLPLVAIHPGATKKYKQWPQSAFSDLCNMLIKKGYFPCLLGAGADDARRCGAIQAAVGKTNSPRLFNLCNQLSLRELACFFLLCKGIVGNDSGPFHLAAAQGLPGVVIFGPSDAGIWGPLSARCRVMQRQDLCDPRCSRRACHADYRCLREIRPAAVLDALLSCSAS